MESSDAAVAQKAMPAVVNISTWKVKQPEKEGNSPRRVKTYGSGFIIDPSGIIVTNKHVIDGAIDIKVLSRMAIACQASCWRLPRWPTLRW